MKIYDLTAAIQSGDVNAYYRTFLSGDPDKDRPILEIMRQRNNCRIVGELNETCLDAVNLRNGGIGL